jgi:hypothetical protein
MLMPSLRNWPAPARIRNSRLLGMSTGICDDDRRCLVSPVITDRLRQSRLLHLLFHAGNDPFSNLYLSFLLLHHHKDIPWIAHKICSQWLITLRRQKIGKSAVCQTRSRDRSHPDCTKEDVAEMTQFLLYPDEKANALEIVPTGLPQVARVCTDSLSLDAKTLESLEVSQQWRDAILSQHGKP